MYDDNDDDDDDDDGDDDDDDSGGDVRFMLGVGLAFPVMMMMMRHTSCSI